MSNFFLCTNNEVLSSASRDGRVRRHVQFRMKTLKWHQNYIWQKGWIPIPVAIPVIIASPTKQGCSIGGARLRKNRRSPLTLVERKQNHAQTENMQNMQIDDFVFSISWLILFLPLLSWRYYIQVYFQYNKRIRIFKEKIIHEFQIKFFEYKYIIVIHS